MLILLVISQNQGFAYINSVWPTYYLCLSMLYTHLYKSDFLLFVFLIYKDTGIYSALQKMTVKEFKEFLLENYYRRTGFTKYQ